MVARIRTVAFEGVDVRPVDAQVQVSGGMPAFIGVGPIPRQTAATRPLGGLWRAAALLRRLVSLCIVASLCACAHQSPFGAVAVGAGYVDPSGDSVYGPLEWCGERLWVSNDDGFVLVDPATGKRLWTAHMADSRSDDNIGELFRCHDHLGQTVHWMDRYWARDHRQRIVWRTEDGASQGQVWNVLRSFYGYPQMDFHGGLAFGIAIDGTELTATGLPRGYRLQSLDEADVRSILGKNKDFRALSLLNESVLALFVWDDRLIGDDLVLLQVDATTTAARPAILAHVVLSDLLPHRGVNFLEAPTLDDDGTIHFKAVMGSHPRQCSLVHVFEPRQDLVCQEVAPGEVVWREKLRVEQWEVLSVSPSGKWVAWGQAEPSDDPTEGEVHLYVAPMSSVVR